MPAHAHTDTLSIVVSLFGKRVLVKSGVFGAEHDPWDVQCMNVEFSSAKVS